MKAAFRLTLVAIAVAACASCGLRGDLDPAPPLYGRAKAEYDAAQAKAAAEKAAADAARPKPATASSATPK